jgi:hypothetical protein
MNRSRAQQGKEITNLKRELRDIDVAIGDFERLEAGSAAKGDSLERTETPKSGTPVRMKRPPRPR